MDQIKKFCDEQNVVQSATEGIEPRYIRLKLEAELSDTDFCCRVLEPVSSSMSATLKNVQSCLQTVDSDVKTLQMYQAENEECADQLLQSINQGLENQKVTADRVSRVLFDMDAHQNFVKAVNERIRVAEIESTQLKNKISAIEANIESIENVLGDQAMDATAMMLEIEDLNSSIRARKERLKKEQEERELQAQKELAERLEREQKEEMDRKAREAQEEKELAERLKREKAEEMERQIKEAREQKELAERTAREEQERRDKEFREKWELAIRMEREAKEKKELEERLAKQEAERLAKNEKERLAKEEKERLAEEIRKQQELNQRLAEELRLAEEERLAKEEQNRMAEEVQKHQKQRSMEKKRREEETRLGEEMRLAEVVRQQKELAKKEALEQNRHDQENAEKEREAKKVLERKQQSKKKLEKKFSQHNGKHSKLPAEKKPKQFNKLQNEPTQTGKEKAIQLKTLKRAESVRTVKSVTPARNPQPIYKMFSAPRPASVFYSCASKRPAAHLMTPKSVTKMGRMVGELTSNYPNLTSTPDSKLSRMDSQERKRIRQTAPSIFKFEEPLDETIDSQGGEHDSFFDD